jgi:hypothetical protein
MSDKKSTSQLSPHKKTIGATPALYFPYSDSGPSDVAIDTVVEAQPLWYPSHIYLCPRRGPRGMDTTNYMSDPIFCTYVSLA